MKVRATAMSVVLFMVAGAGFAAEPDAPTASSQAATATAAPQAPVTAKAVQAPAAAAAAQAPVGPTMATARDAAALTVSAHDLGYTKRLRDGKTVYYCKSDATIGTRMPSTKCYTEDQMSAVVERTAANRQSIEEWELKHLTEPNKY
jgi:hypothetical protein